MQPHHTRIARKIIQHPSTPPSRRRGGLVSGSTNASMPYEFQQLPSLGQSVKIHLRVFICNFFQINRMWHTSLYMKDR